MSFRNRCRIAGAGGTVDLSIPLEKGRDQKSFTKDIRISGSRRWQAEHWKTLLSCYSRSPWFEFYRDELEQLYRKPVAFLVDWDLACFEWSVRALGMKTGISFTEAFHKNYEVDGWVDWRGQVSNGVGVVKPGAGEGSGPIWKGGAQSVGEVSTRYRQVFEERTGFLPDLSILDLLFCEGKNAGLLLSR